MMNVNRRGSKNIVGFSFLLIAVMLVQRGTAQPEGGHIAAALIPYPQKIQWTGSVYQLGQSVSIQADKKASAADLFAADMLQQFLREELKATVTVNQPGTAGSRISLSRKGADKKLGAEGYSLSVQKENISIKAGGEAGLFYGVQTLIQLWRSATTASAIDGVEITDWPDTRIRAIHYDTKHHQDKKSYVQQFIRELAAYKVNMLLWEWEDKFAYPSHPEIGAPGAFTMQEMQELTRYAQQYHIQIVPLVQGLGHAGFILKWPQHAHLREVAESNFEFCPLKDSSYLLLKDLWQDAIEATPGSDYIHIGSDETYELGACEVCRQKVKTIGKTGLYHLFLERSAKMLQQQRQVVAWEAPMGWEKRRLQAYHQDMTAEGNKKVVPVKGLVMSESYDYETPDLRYARQAKALGYPVWAYDPNPGIEQLFLPYFFSKNDDGEMKPGAVENSVRFLKENLGKGAFDGLIKTSWDDSGLPMQDWMLSFATAAAFSWNAAGPDVKAFTTHFFRERYGAEAVKMDSLYYLLNEGAYFYMESFERRVWAWGEIGKTHLPDLPRGDAVEYDPYWNTQYAGRVTEAKKIAPKMDRAIAICRKNLSLNIRSHYDVEIFLTLAQLMRHTAQTYLDLSALEQEIKAAHLQRFTNLEGCYNSLLKAQQLLRDQLKRRKQVYDELVLVWDQTRLPKGMSTQDKPYFFQQERTRHFANRVPDMSYLIVDEQKLGIEVYLRQLEQYSAYFKETFLRKNK